MNAVADIGTGAEPATSARVRGDARSQGLVVLRFLVLSVIHLFMGTVQGVFQTFPGIAQWIREAGPAGHLIDPLAHAHINLVGGVTMGMMGLIYYVLPKVLGRDVYSPVLARGFVLALHGGRARVLLLAPWRWEPWKENMIHGGMTYSEALAVVGPIHHILIITTAFLMGFGYWAFILNVLMTVVRKRGD